MSIFEANGVGKSFSGVTALAGVDLRIEPGEVVGLIGPNGAGKTTFFNAVTGVLTPDSGTVQFNGEDIGGRSPAEIAQQGMVRTFQMSRELGAMTVRDNIALGAQHHPGETLRGSLFQSEAAFERERVVAEETEQLMQFLDLSHLADEYAKKLSGGQRKLLGLGRALMTDPEMILLDEPFAGVNPTLSGKIVERIESLNDEEGMTFLIVEHEIETLVELCDRLVVLHNGQVLTDGDPETVVNDETVIDAYLGGALQA